MAVAVEQQHCDRCHAPLRKGAAYCDECGTRTRRARRMVRMAVRIEIIILILVCVLILGFAYIYYTQG
jgi:predicted nucleic acid-binding Zn ribbon protein